MTDDISIPASGAGSSNTVHVVTDGEDWTLEVEGGGEVPSRFATEDQAVEAGRDLARNRGADIEVHGADGEVKLRDSYDFAD